MFKWRRSSLNDRNRLHGRQLFLVTVCTETKMFKEDILIEFGRENVGRKMVYNCLGIDEKYKEIYLHSIRISMRYIRTSVQGIQTSVQCIKTQQYVTTDPVTVSFDLANLILYWY